MRLLLLLLLVFSVILVSGCTIPGTDIEIPFIPDIGGATTATSDILIIKQLNAYPEKIREDQTIRLVAYVQSVGGKDIVEGVNINLYDYCTGVFEDLKVSCNGKESGGTNCKIDKIYPKQTVEVYWTLSPLYIKDKTKLIKLETPCTLKVSATYPYKTTALSTINFVNYEEMQRQIEDGSYKTKSSMQNIGEGPVKPNIKILEPQPIPAKRGGNEKTPITFELSDKGSGFVVQPEPKKYNLWVTEIIYTYKEGENTCTYPGETNELAFAEVHQQITLMQERSSTITCSLTKPNNVEKERTDNIRITINYDYEIRKEKKVTVTPIPETVK